MSEGVVVPEAIIYNTLETIKKILKNDISDNTGSPEKSILYRLLGVDAYGKEIKINKYIYFEQANNIFGRAQDLNVYMGYNMKPADGISLHIILPSEGYYASSLGSDFDDQTDEETETNQAGEVENYQRGSMSQLFESNYQIMITSDNSSEIGVVYNVLKSMLVILIPHLEILGLKIPKISGNDIIMQQDRVPVPLFHKVLNLNFVYELKVPELISNKIIKDFVFEGKMFFEENIN